MLSLISNAALLRQVCGHDPEPWVEAISTAVVEECRRLDWPLPRLVLEPGRWLVARAGVAAFLLNVVLQRLVATQREQIAALKALGYRNDHPVMKKAIEAAMKKMDAPQGSSN